jgi:hypothetical protein
MTDLTGKQFRMVTNMKAKPNSQGTLFQGGHPRAGAGQPWPRGFSPERRDEVLDALVRPGNRFWMQSSRGKPALDIHGNKTLGGTKPESIRTYETIARSTVPVEHLAGLGGVSAGQIRGPRTDGDPAGTYHRYGFGGTKDRPGEPQIAIYQGMGNASGSTPIHEIGHHVSFMAGTEHSAYDTPERKGQEEGFAENYAETHYRDHRGRPLKELQTSPWSWAKSMPEEHQGSFSRAFGDERRKAPSAVRKRQEQDAALNRTPTPIRGQLQLLDKQISGYGKDEEVSIRPTDLDRDPKYMPEFNWNDRRKS